MIVTVEADPLDVSVDALELVADLAATMPDYYAQTFLRGDLPEGGAAPTNSKGQPLGVGSGTIGVNWWVDAPSGNAQLASVSTGPFQEGGHFYAVRARVEQGASPVSSEGRAGVKIDEVVQRGADRAVGIS